MGSDWQQLPQEPVRAGVSGFPHHGLRGDIRGAGRRDRRVRQHAHRYMEHSRHDRAFMLHFAENGGNF